MKRIKLILAVTSMAAFFTENYSCSQKTASDTLSVFGIFVARTPCSEGTRPLPGIPLTADCELIRWHLTLYKNPETVLPSSFKLEYVYGLAQQGTTGFIGGGTKVELQGALEIVKGTASNPNAIVYRLTDNKTNKTFSFLKLNDNLLHLLDSDQRLMIGTAAWSYTLNRIGNE